MFWYSGISTTPGQSFSAKENEIGLRREKREDTIQTMRSSENLEYFQQLISLEWNVLFGVQLRLLSFKDWSQTGQFCHDAADSPAVYSFIIVLRTHEKLRGAIPDCHHNLVTGKQWLEGLVNQTGKAKVTDLDDAT
jgi:hypothetical protein